MSRAVEEWKGKTDDTPIPDRVKLRVASRTLDHCQQCARPIGGKLRAEFDHVIPLCLGGENRESNLALVCNECHLGKTKRDVKIKAKVARVRVRHLGIAKRSSRPIPGSKASGLRKRMNGVVERRGFYRAPII